MSHKSGFEDLAIGGRVFVRSSTDIMPLDAYLKKEMPARVRPPGELTAYSNYGSELAAYIVEQVSGMPFDEYVEQNILLPLDMNNTTFDQPLPSRLASNMSNGYVYEDNAYIAKPFEYLQVWPAGSMSSTSEDMAKFMLPIFKTESMAIAVYCRKIRHSKCTAVSSKMTQEFAAWHTGSWR